MEKGEAKKIETCGAFIGSWRAQIVQNREIGASTHDTTFRISGERSIVECKYREALVEREILRNVPYDQSCGVWTYLSGSITDALLALPH